MKCSELFLFRTTFHVAEKVRLMFAQLYSFAGSFDGEEKFPKLREVIVII